MEDITRYRGDTAADLLNVVDGAGTAVDITGFSFVLSVNSLENPPTVTTQMYSIVGVILDSAGGVVEFVPSASQADQKAFSYFYDIEMTDDSGRVKTIAKGSYTYLQDITK